MITSASAQPTITQILGDWTVAQCAGTSGSQLGGTRCQVAYHRQGFKRPMLGSDYSESSLAPDNGIEIPTNQKGGSRSA